jgi:hypothetical protein
LESVPSQEAPGRRQDPTECDGAHTDQAPMGMDNSKIHSGMLQMEPDCAVTHSRSTGSGLAASYQGRARLTKLQPRSQNIS